MSLQPQQSCDHNSPDMVNCASRAASPDGRHKAMAKDKRLFLNVAVLERVIQVMDPLKSVFFSEYVKVYNRFSKCLLCLNLDDSITVL